MFALSDGFEITLVLSGASSLAVVLWMAWRKKVSRSAHVHARFFLHPWVQLVIVCALLMVNQVLYNAYVLAAHGGDPSFLARYLGPGWCQGTPNAPIVKLLAAHVPAAWLSLTVLRVQAFLELPFALLAYLSIAYLLDRALYRALVRSPLIVLASASFTAAFCLVEQKLPNPWTESDLLVRAVSAVVTPAWLVMAARGERGKAHFPAADGRPRTLVGLLAFFAGALAVATLVLVVYDVALLYNLGHLAAHAELLALATLVASAAFWGARRADRWTARIWGAGDDAPVPASIATSSAALVVFTAVFFVPSLVLRYWGPHTSAVILAAMLILTGAAGGVAWEVRTLGPGLGPLARWTSGACVAVAVGVSSCVTDGMGLARAASALSGEELLLRKSLLLALPAIVAWRIYEALVGPPNAPLPAPRASTSRATTAHRAPPPGP